MTKIAAVLGFVVKGLASQQWWQKPCMSETQRFWQN